MTFIIRELTGVGMKVITAVTVAALLLIAAQFAEELVKALAELAAFTVLGYTVWQKKNRLNTGIQRKH
jgi:hypothetical protein